MIDKDCDWGGTECYDQWGRAFHLEWGPGWPVRTYVSVLSSMKFWKTQIALCICHSRQCVGLLMSAAPRLSLHQTPQRQVGALPSIWLEPSTKATGSRLNNKIIEQVSNGLLGFMLKLRDTFYLRSSDNFIQAHAN
jgi:hypothetical protein